MALSDFNLGGESKLLKDQSTQDLVLLVNLIWGKISCRRGHGEGIKCNRKGRIKAQESISPPQKAFGGAHCEESDDLFCSK